MPKLHPQEPDLEHRKLAEGAVLLLSDHPALQAAIWLYVDDLEESHAIAQTIDSPIGAYWHGIVHRREGDFWNAKYWFRQVSSIPLVIDDYEPSRFVDQVESVSPGSPIHLVEMQRREWAELFALCAKDVL